MMMAGKCEGPRWIVGADIRTLFSLLMSSRSARLLPCTE